MFEGNRAVNGRNVGVGLPTDQVSPRNSAPPRTVAPIALVETYAVPWVDDDGRPHMEFMHRVGSEWYRAPNGENYTATLRRISSDSWLVKKIEAKLAEQKDTAVPTEDAVDVLAGEGG